MKNKIILIVAFISFSLFFAPFTFAEDVPPVVPIDIHLKIISSKTSFYDANISVNACDSDKDINTPDIITPYCAILQSEVSNVWDWSWAPGAFVTSIADISGYTSKDKEDKDVYHYWSWSLNGSEAMVGLNQYELKKDDSVLLSFVPVEEIIEEVVPPPKHGSSGSYIIKPVIIEKVFNLENALKFLEQNQKVDGSFGNLLYTDWATMAAVAGDGENIKEKLIKYYKEDNLESNLVTDNERRAMALMALDIDPYSGTKINYIKKIVDSFDGTQFGDKTQDNDDIFALIVLKNAGYNENDELVKKDINYLISKEKKDGSWGSIDMTVAYIEAMKDFENITGVRESILKSKSYIISNQKSDGGFENISSTSWVLQSLYDNDQILKAEKYLASKQETDGGMESVGTDLNTRIWATSYAIPAILHKPWSEILNNFSKPDISTNTVTVNKNEVIKQNRKVDPKISNINSGEVIKSVEDKKKIENIVDNNGEVKVNKPSNIWYIISVPFNWLLVKLGF